MTSDDPIAAGREAWQRIRESGRRNFDDWCVVARALDIGRAGALEEAGTDRPFGSYYTAAIGRWLRHNGFYGLDGNRGERAQMHRMLANLPAIMIWRQSLNEEQRRRCNHPATVVLCWRRSITKAETANRKPVVAKVAATQRQHVAPSVTAEAAETETTSRYTKPRAIYWSQDAIKRAAVALRQCNSNDTFVMARRALEAAIRCEGDLLELMPPPAQVKTKTAPDVHAEKKRQTAPAAIALQ